MSSFGEETRRELPEGVDRKQIRVIPVVREVIDDIADARGCTYSEALASALPEEPHDIEHSAEDIVSLKVTPEVHDRVSRLTGQRFTLGDVVSFYILMEMGEHMEAAQSREMIARSPDIIWEGLKDGKFQRD